jgi:hypothetical protein
MFEVAGGDLGLGAQVDVDLAVPVDRRLVDQAQPRGLLGGEQRRRRVLASSTGPVALAGGRSARVGRPRSSAWSTLRATSC